MCYDRTSIGLKPMCATVCPSQALFFGPKSEIERYRKNIPNNQFIFGKQKITTKVYMMMDTSEVPWDMDVANFMSQVHLDEIEPWVV
jgi:Fe-S-cluster-containing dehydrogenase component